MDDLGIFKKPIYAPSDAEVNRLSFFSGHRVIVVYVNTPDAIQFSYTN